MHPSFWDFPWPSARAFCFIIGIVFGVKFVQTLVSAILLSTRTAHNGTANMGVLGKLAGGYLVNMAMFWAAALAFIAAYKG